MKTAVWFSRDQPSRKQMVDAAHMGFAIEAIDEGMALCNRDIQDEKDLSGVLADLRALVEQRDAEAVFGVFPAPIVSVLYMGIYSLRVEARRVPIYAAWNISRLPEGGKPTFAHKEWCLIGVLRF